MTSFGQSNHTIKQQLKECRDSLEVEKQIILDFAELLESAELNRQNSSELLQKLNKENEILRRIMRDYVKQIDEMNMKNLSLQTELDKCRNK